MDFQPGVFFERLGIILTYRCNISCDHCLPMSGPTRRESLTLDKFSDWIQQAAMLSTVKTISITGGEPFTDPDLLMQAIALCRSFGLPVIVMTNGFWGTTVERAAALLSEMPGLVAVGLSTDRFHWQHVPIIRVKNVIEACRAMGLQTLVRVSYTRDKDREIEEAIGKLGEHYSMLDCFECQPTIPFGRAKLKLAPDAYFRYSPLNIPCQVADVPIITPDGRIYACCGPVIGLTQKSTFYLGDLGKERLTIIYERAQMNIALHIIRTFGPGRLLYELNRRGCQITCNISDGICGICWDLLSEPRAIVKVEEMQHDQDFLREVAVARMLLLGECEMIVRQARSETSSNASVGVSS